MNHAVTNVMYSRGAFQKMVLSDKFRIFILPDITDGVSILKIKAISPVCR